jgi:hypothetical protein
MASLVKILSILLLNLHLRAAELPQFITKQSSENIRYLSSNSKFTYFQNNSGTLFLSTNYKNEEILIGAKSTQYNIVGSPERKYLLISKDETFHSVFTPLKSLSLYIVKYGDKTAKKVGEGVDPRLHMNDTWLSFFIPETKSIQIVSTQLNDISFTIKTINQLNPFFIPQIVMFSNEDIFYTDLNENGIPGLIKFSKSNKKSSIMYKANSQEDKIELCKCNDQLFIGIFPLNTQGRESSIFKTQVQKNISLDIKKFYNNSEKDLGKMVCAQNDLYFIKTDLELGRRKYNVYKTSTSNLSLSKLTDLNFVTQLLLQEDKILIPFKDKTYVIYTKNEEI